MSDQPKPDLGLLEEDDEFEEFPAEGKWMLYVIDAVAFSGCRPSLAKSTT